MTEYAQVLKMLGNGRVEAMCFDGEKRLAHIRGKMRKKVRAQYSSRFIPRSLTDECFDRSGKKRFGSIKETSSFFHSEISRTTRPTLFKSTLPTKLVTSKLTVNFPKLPRSTKPILSDLETRTTTSSSTKFQLTRLMRIYLRSKTTLIS